MTLSSLAEPSPDTVRVGRTRVHRLTTQETLDQIEGLLAEPGVHQHVVVNAAKVVAAEKDPELLASIEGCDIVNADGMSVVWASRLLGDPLPERVTGIDIMHELLRRAADRGWPVYLLGAKQPVIEEVVRRLTAELPTLKIAGARNGYWSEAEDADVVRGVRESGAKLLFVAMPTPKKEHWVAKHRHDLGVGLVMGVGGSFDVVAGVTQRAPETWQKYGMEWAYRLKQEPRRMWRRYLFGNSQFIMLVARQRLARDA